VIRGRGGEEEGQRKEENEIRGRERISNSKNRMNISLQLK
jgi:hypothetical protein